MVMLSYAPRRFISRAASLVDGYTPRTMSKLKVIEFYGGPGAGKSTTASHLFSRLKLMRAANRERHLSVELVTEVAKERVWQGLPLNVQASLMGLQYERLHRLFGKVDIAVSDSPLALCKVYRDPELYPSPQWEDVVDAHYKHLDVLSVYLHRVKPYEIYGRNQTEEEAKEIDLLLRPIFDAAPGHHFEVDGDEEAADLILDNMRDIEWIR